MLLSAKLLAFHALWFRMRHGFDRPFLPFFSALDHPTIVAIWPALLGLIFAAGVVLLAFNLAPRLGAAGVGSALLLDLLASRIRYSNNTLFFDLLLLIIALSGPRDRWRVGLRAQIALLYAGAAINKLFLPDWHSGQFFRFWTHDVLQLGWVARLEEGWGVGFSIVMSWFTIVLEFLLVVLVCRPKYTWLFVALALSFHVGMLIFTGGVFSWIFFRVMLVAYLGLLQGPVGPPARQPPDAPLWQLLLGWPAPGTERNWRSWAVWACFPVWWFLRNR